MVKNRGNEENKKCISMLNNVRYMKIKYPEASKAKFYLTEVSRISGKSQSRLIVEAVNNLVEKSAEYAEYRAEAIRLWKEHLRRK